MTTREKFAKRLRQARRRAELTQEQLAEKAGIKRRTYAAYETARNQPSLDILVRIARALKCSVDWLIGMEDDDEIH